MHYNLSRPLQAVNVSPAKREEAASVFLLVIYTSTRRVRDNWLVPRYQTIGDGVKDGSRSGRVFQIYSDAEPLSVASFII